MTVADETVAGEADDDRFTGDTLRRFTAIVGPDTESRIAASGVLWPDGSVRATVFREEVRASFGSMDALVQLVRDSEAPEPESFVDVELEYEDSQRQVGVAAGGAGQSDGGDSA